MAQASGASTQTFSVGEFVYDPTHSWSDLRSGMICERDGEQFVYMPRRLPEERDLPMLEYPLSQYPGTLLPHVLINLKTGRTPLGDPKPWWDVYDKTLAILRDADRRRLLLEELVEELHKGLSPDAPVEAALRMMASMGVTKVDSLKTGLIYRLSDIMKHAYDRIEYLASLSAEMRAKSRRIDLLLDHKGTVGSYREELLRAVLRQLVPRQFEISTGFIVGCPRQIDILIWDSSAFAPLFREHEVVVVPRQAARAVIEVKTTLHTTSLDDALEILWDVFRNHPSTVPVFKGIFAFESDYHSEMAVAARMKEFYSTIDKQGLSRNQTYIGEGVTAVCVPESLLVQQQYRVSDGDNVHPQPHLIGASSEWPGDTKMPLFLGALLAHLDLPEHAKQWSFDLFSPLTAHVSSVPLLDIHDHWSPTSARADSNSTFTTAGANEYWGRVLAFYRGELRAEDLSDPRANTTTTTDMSTLTGGPTPHPRDHAPA